MIAARYTRKLLVAKTAQLVLSKCQDRFRTADKILSKEPDDLQKLSWIYPLKTFPLYSFLNKYNWRKKIPCLKLKPCVHIWVDTFSHLSFRFETIFNRYSIATGKLTFFIFISCFVIFSIFFFHLQELPAKKFNAHSIYASANDPPFSICSCNSMPFKFTFNSPVSFLSVSPLLIHDDRIFFLLFFFFVFIFSFLFSLIIRCH